MQVFGSVELAEFHVADAEVDGGLEVGGVFFEELEVELGGWLEEAFGSVLVRL